MNVPQSLHGVEHEPCALTRCLDTKQQYVPRLHAAGGLADEDDALLSADSSGSSLGRACVSAISMSFEGDGLRFQGKDVMSMR